MQKNIPENKPKLKKIDKFLSLNYKEIKNLSDKELVKNLRYFRTDLNKYDLRKPLSYYKRRKIRDIRDIYLENLSVPNPTLYRPAKKNRKIVAEKRNLSNKWKVFVIDKLPDQKIVVKNGRLLKVSKYTTEEELLFDLEKLAIDPQKELNRTLGKNTFDIAKLMCGDAFIGGHLGFKDYGASKSKIVKDELLNDINILMSKYADPEQNNFWNNWLFGVSIVKLRNQSKKDYRNKKINIYYKNRNNKSKSNGKKKRSRRGL
jgi:hypothetical protein